MILNPTALISQLGTEAAETLSAALERVLDLGTSGRIDRDGLRALRNEIDWVRRAGIMAQQVVRLAAGEVRLQREHVNLRALLDDCLTQGAKEIELRGAEVRQQLAGAHVVCDPTLCFSLLQTLLDWSFQHAVSRIDLRLDNKSWPARARITCGYFYRRQDNDSEWATLAPAPGEGEPRLNTVSWLLIKQIGLVQGLVVQRHDGAGRTLAVIEFPETLAASPRDLPGLEADDPVMPSDGSRPLSGQHVLLIAPQLDIRNRVRDALQDMGLSLEVVASLAQIGQSGTTGMPHAVVFEDSVQGVHFDIWRQHMVSKMPTMAFICIDDGERDFEVIKTGGIEQARVSRPALSSSLPVALLFELTRQS